MQASLYRAPYIHHLHCTPARPGKVVCAARRQELEFVLPSEQYTWDSDRNVFTSHSEVYRLGAVAYVTLTAVDLDKMDQPEVCEGCGEAHPHLARLECQGCLDAWCLKCLKIEDVPEKVSHSGCVVSYALLTCKQIVPPAGCFVHTVTLCAYSTMLLDIRLKFDRKCICDHVTALPREHHETLVQQLQDFWCCNCKSGTQRTSVPDFSMQRHYLRGGKKIGLAELSAFREVDGDIQFQCRWIEARHVKETNKQVSAGHPLCKYTHRKWVRALVVLFDII